jgi:isocitrate dehydrogenase kinase/phosphatase
MTEPTTLATRAADTIHGSFDEYHNLFREITRRTRQRFERCDWDGIKRDTVRRLDLHEKTLADALDSLDGQLGPQLADRGLWMQMKAIYSHEVLGRDDFELAQTFFNSLTRRIFPHDGVDPAIDYTVDEFPLPYRGWEMASARMYAVHTATPEVLMRIIEDARFQAPFEDLRRDAERAAARIEARVEKAFGSPGFEALDMLRPVLVRNKAAYVVGRARRGDRLMPVILAILNEDGRLHVDAVLTAEEDASVLFSFARWYFHADIGSPREVIGFLHSILPRKEIAELYISLGYNKHGKTEFYRELMRYIANTEERFTVAPGVPGLVMEVFTLPSFEFVFKLIKDYFPPEKRTTRADVRERYKEVLRHDRVGRLVDFQQFVHVKFPRSRFEDALLEQLLGSSARNVAVVGDDVVIRHMYIGRRVTPLDIYLRRHGESDAARLAVNDWGTALKELAAANIFAGDMLLKNFGVTRHGRVVFYDYDELCPVAECKFRKIPPARSMEEEMSAEPWFSVADEDVFPEELRTFMGLSEGLLGSFDRSHGDLFEVEFWKSIQERHRAGEVLDFYPYADGCRL